MSETPAPTCFVCGCDNDVPLISLIYKGKPAWICPEDIPRLIHNTETLSEALDRAAAS